MKKLILLLALVSCTKLNPPVEVPVPAPAHTLFVLDSFNHPDQDTVNWKTEATRTVFKNQTTGFVFKGDLCLLKNAKSWIISPIEITNSSAKEYAKGTYYDALLPLDSNNCASSKYAWVDVDSDSTFGTLKITIRRLDREAPTNPSIPLMIQLDPFNYAKGLNKKVVDNDEVLALDALKLLKEHRLQPMKSWVTPYNTYSNKWGLKEYVVDFSPTFASVPHYGDLKKLNADVVTNKVDRPWFYVVDEPNTAKALAELKPQLAKLKKDSPNVSTMVTTTLQKDFLIDIYCPVAEHLGVNGYPGREAYSRLWMYVSCMSNGCGDNRAWTSGKFTHVDYARTGAPDLSIDAPLSDAFGFYSMAIKYNLEALLYYNSIEQWGLFPFGVDVFKDQYNFGANGDGTILYPDYLSKKPLPSLRLKMLREASYFADAVIVSGSKEDVAKKVTSTLKWSFDYADRELIYSKVK